MFYMVFVFSNTNDLNISKRKIHIQKNHGTMVKYYEILTEDTKNEKKPQTYVNLQNGK